MYVEKYHVQKSILWPIFGCKNQVKFPTLGSLITFIVAIFSEPMQS